MYGWICTAHIVCLYSTRGTAGIRGQEEGCGGEHAGSSWASESTHPLHGMSAGLHRAGERPRLLELGAAGQVGWSQVSHQFLALERLIYTSGPYFKIQTTCMYGLCIPSSEIHLFYKLFLHRTSRFASFPEYLVLQIKKFTFGVDWVPKKLGKYLFTFRIRV